MQTPDWIQFCLYVAVLALITKPMGLYLVQVLDINGRTWLDRVIKPLERVTYRLMRVRPDEEQDWKQYTFAMLGFSLVSMLVHLCDSAGSASAAAEPAKVCSDERASRFQHCRQFHHQHRLAELRR